MKLVVSKKDVAQDGILYVLLVQLEDKALVKVGVTCRAKVEDRITEILVSIWKRYRVFPELYPKRYKSTLDVYGKEARLHKLLEDYRYKTKHKFSGSTEMFDVDLDVVVSMYEEMLNEDSNKE
jgi:hypothetical protein